MDKHVKALGLLHVGYGVIALGSIYGLVFLTMRAGHIFGVSHIPSYYNGFFDFNGYEILRIIGFHLAAIVGILGLGSIIAGCGLIGHKSWARVMVLVLGIIALFNIPFGTALGIYTIWVVLKPETKELTVS